MSDPKSRVTVQPAERFFFGELRPVPTERCTGFLKRYVWEVR